MYRVIIFDIDGTLYDLNDVCELNYQMQVDFYSKEMHASVEETISVFDENGIMSYKSDKAKSATEFFLRIGLDGDKWKRYRESHYSPCVINRKCAARESVLADFAKICDIVLLSSNTYENVIATLNWIDIDASVFKDIFCSTRNPGGEPFNKKDAIKGILKKMGIQAEEALSVGDRYSTDIEPLVSMGGAGVLVSGPNALPHVYRDLLHDHLVGGERNGYEFYG